MEGCFMFQWRGFIFKWRGGCPMGGHQFWWWGFSKKIIRWGVGGPPQAPPPHHYGKTWLSDLTFSLFRSLFSFCTDVLHLWWLLKVKKRIKKALYKQSNSFYYFLIFCFKGLNFKTQFKIEFWPLLNGVQLGLE